MLEKQFFQYSCILKAIPNLYFYEFAYVHIFSGLKMFLFFQVKGGKLPAHRFILVSKIEKSISHLLKFDEALGKFVYDLKKHDMNTVQSWLSDVYSGRTRQTIESFGLRKCHTKEGYDLANSDCELNGFSMHAFSMRDIESPDRQGTRIFCDENGAVYEHLPNTRKAKKKKEQMVLSQDNRR